MKVSNQPFRGLGVQIALPFLVFVVAGSVALTAWLETNFQRESREKFAALAKTNADFIRGSRLARSERTAGDLSRILNLEVYFQKQSGELVPPGVQNPGQNYEEAAAPLDEGDSLILIRAKPVSTAHFQPLTLLVLAVFWALTLALAWALTRGVVRPLRLLGKMATGLAHEIHNPLSGIRMHLQLLDSATPSELPAVAAESIPIALGETAKIENLVNQWMFLVRPEPPRTSPADVGELIGGITRLIQPLADHARVDISREIPGGLRVAADSRRLGQALGNVMLNAIQAMPGGGSLRVAARNGSGMITVTFHDSGGGFSEKALAHYADLFYSEREGGMGIGLNVASEIVKAHRGALRVGNGPGGGAVVTIELPASSQ